jgi:hypothetical protein
MIAVTLLLAACDASTSDPPEVRETPRVVEEILDDRAPVPLLAPMAAHQRAQMREHLEAVQEVVGALSRDDLDAAARAGERLGTSESMAAMCSHMGAGAPGFTERALAFHRTADSIAIAAEAGDRNATLSALDTTLAHCTSCHRDYRQQIVDERTFAETTRQQ